MADTGRRDVTPARRLLFALSCGAGSVVAAISCGTDSSAPQDGGAADAPTATDDATSAASEASTDAGSTDAGATDGATPTDAATKKDTGSDVAVAPPVTCSAATIAAVTDAGLTLLFCADFDESPDAGIGWSSVLNSTNPAGSIISRDTTNAASAPGSARFFQTGGAPIGSSGFGQLKLEQFGIALPDAGAFTISFDWRADSPANSLQNVVRAYGAGSANDSLDLRLTTNPEGGANLIAQWDISNALGPGGAFMSATQTFDAGLWHHVQAHFAGQFVTLTVDSWAAGTYAYPYGDPAFMHLNVAVGIESQPLPEAGTGFDIDNVRITTP
jgi:hypothetical protein